MKKTFPVFMVVSLVALVLSNPAEAKKAKSKTSTEELTPAPVVAPVADDTKIKRFTHSAALGFVYNTYNSALVSTDQFSLMAKLSSSYRFEKIDRLSLGLSGFYTLLPLSKTHFVSATGVADDVSIRFLGLNLRLAYDTPWLPQPWNLSIATGWYVNTTFVTNSRFGYEWVNGPQLYPQLSYKWNDRTWWSSYLKFSPVMTGASTVLKIDENFEAALGGQFVFPTAWLQDHLAVVSLDFAHLQVKPAVVKVFANTLSMNFGVLF